jgi:hypothetical protein
LRNNFPSHQRNILFKIKFREKYHEVKNNVNIPGNFFGFLNGTNFAPIANAIGGPKIKPLASIPVKQNVISIL